MAAAKTINPATTVIEPENIFLAIQIVLSILIASPETLYRNRRCLSRAILMVALWSKVTRAGIIQSNDRTERRQVARRVRRLWNLRSRGSHAFDLPGHVRAAASWPGVVRHGRFERRETGFRTGHGIRLGSFRRSAARSFAGRQRDRARALFHRRW